MAGGGSAYRRLQKPEDGLSQSTQYWGGQAARRNNMFLRNKMADERLKAAEARAAQRKFDEDFADNLSSIKAFDTKNNDLNTLVIRGVERAKDKMYEYAKIADPANTSTSREEKIRAMAEMKKLEAIPEKMKIMSNAITQQITANQKGLEEGTLRATPEAETFMKSGYDLGRDNEVVNDILIKDGEIYYGYKGKDGVPRTISFKEVSSGQMPGYLPKWDRETALAEGNKLMGTFTNSEQEGFTTTKDVTLNEQSQQLAQALSNKTFSISENGQNSIALKNVLMDMGMDPNTTLNEEQLNQIRDQFRQDLGANLSLSHSESIDQSAMTSRMRENRARQKEEDQYSTPEIATDSSGKPVMRNVREVYSASDLPNKEGYVVTLGGGKPVTLEETPTRKIEVANPIITPEGDVYADTVEFVKEDDGYGKQVWREVTGKEKGSLNKSGARKLGETTSNNLFRNSTLRKENGDKFKNKKEFLDYIDAKYNSKEGTKNSKKQIDNF